jgi:hypothetical protein
MFISDYNAGSALPDYVGAFHVETGDTFWSSKFNRNAAYLDILSQSGCGMIAISDGLNVSTVSGLTVSVAPGTALINGIIQNKNSTNVVVNNNTTNYLWFKKDGTFEVTTTTTPPASMPSIYIGLVVTVSGSVTVTDKSGVVYNKSGVMYRETNDTYSPTGTIDSSLFVVTKTKAGSYLWDGAIFNSVSPIKEIQAVTANKTETSADRDIVVTNTGASSKPIITLETASVGLVRQFIVTDSDGIRIKANSGDTIRVINNITASAGYVESTAVGSFITLICYASNSWICSNFCGPWTNGTWTSRPSDIFS